MASFYQKQHYIEGRTVNLFNKFQDSAMVQLRESLFLEKQKTVDTLRDELEQERREISIRADERLAQQLADHASTIKVSFKISWIKEAG